MADKRELAGAILEEARHLVTKDRHEQHGDASDTFTAIGAFWSTYLRAKGVDLKTDINAIDVAEMMAQVKTVRRAMGDPRNADNYIDGAGYIALAGMLAGVSFAKST